MREEKQEKQEKQENISGACSALSSALNETFSLGELLTVVVSGEQIYPSRGHK